MLFFNLIKFNLLSSRGSAKFRSASIHPRPEVRVGARAQIRWIFRVFSEVGKRTEKFERKIWEISRGSRSFYGCERKVAYERICIFGRKQQVSFFIYFQHIVEFVSLWLFLYLIDFPTSLSLLFPTSYIILLSSFSVFPSLSLFCSFLRDKYANFHVFSELGKKNWNLDEKHDRFLEEVNLRWNNLLDDNNKCLFFVVLNFFFLSFFPLLFLAIIKISFHFE
jgi:hypothetical protein